MTKNPTDISPLNFLYIGIMGLWLYSYKFVFIASSMTSTGLKVGQILKLLDLHQYFNSVDQKLKILEMFMAILLVYSTSGIASGKRFVATSKWRLFWKFWNIKLSFYFDLSCEKNVPNYAKKVFFTVMMSSMTSQGDLKVAHYIHV